jgi:hypothetical protein
MKTLRHRHSATTSWAQYLDRIVWLPASHDHNVREAFETALLLGISRSEAFVDVAEKIHRSFQPVNWGVMNHLWKEALNDNKLSHTRKSVPYQAKDREQNKPASLVNYYT